MTDELAKSGSGVRGLFKYDHKTRQVVPVESAPKLEVNAPFVHIDTIEPTVSHASFEGKKFTSKKLLRQHYRENGYIETGGEQAKPEREDPEKRAAEIRDDVERALNDLRWGNVPATEEEKELWRREQRELEAYKKRQRY